ncbi:hypothetical protein OE88DRAFT_1772963 [Heliocybe sulcata]|uniref:Vacuolar protein-sorting-associated protein 36 n=1 Tax=Heliocybe sulcata TaxID=5364 RepID=A0A5C3N051_9AGAM|nr:hypothetical protein OE88DRAFT_1772963 [Heliocybe sulcata]
MALARFTKPVDGTIPVPALLYDDEDVVTNQDGVGIYDGSVKSPLHQTGVLTLTSHRLFFISVPTPSDSFSLDLSHIVQTDYYAGLLRSSAKITLRLNASTDGKTDAVSGDSSEDGEWATWECEVCGNRNGPGLSPAKAAVCSLCGVPRAISSSGSTTPRALPSQAKTSLTSTSLPALTTGGAGSPGSSPDGSSDIIACPACTFHNHPSLRVCEICATPLPRPPSSNLAMRSLTASPAPSAALASGDASSMRLSFRKGGDKAFYAALKRALHGKRWQVTKTTNTRPYNTQDTVAGGVSGIMTSVQNNAQQRNTSISTALSDLEALMSQAQHMVALASELTEQIRVAEAKAKAEGRGSLSDGTEEGEAANFIQTSLAQLGLSMTNAPVTQDMMKDERKWMEELARELSGLTQQERKKTSGIMRGRGIVALDEVWGGWNRARGVALIPPSTFLQVLALLPSYTSPPLLMRTFPSGLSVLHTPRYTHVAFTSRLSSLIALSGPRTTLEVAREERVTVPLAGEMIAEVERDGEICRDEVQIEGPFGGGRDVRWWINVFEDYVWDGQQDT